jgi:MFS family permease
MSPTQFEATESAVTACLAEYEALQAEMHWLRKEAAQYQGFALAIAAATGPLLGFEFASHPSWVVPTLVIIPIPFAVLGFLFFRQHLEVYVVSAYVRDRVRPQLSRLTAMPDLWTWEEFKYVHLSRTARGRRFGFIINERMAVAMRTTLFLWPAVFAVIGALVLTIQAGAGTITRSYGWSGIVAMLVVLLADVCLVVLFLALLWVRGDLPETVLNLTPNDRNRLLRKLAWRRPAPDGVATTSAGDDEG